MILFVVISVMAVCACQSTPVPAQCPQIPSLDLEKEEPNLTKEMLTVFIAQRGDEAIKKLNYCIDRYEAVRQSMINQ